MVSGRKHLSLSLKTSYPQLSYLHRRAPFVLMTDVLITSGSNITTHISPDPLPLPGQIKGIFECVLKFAKLI
jgi:hypothetical protein